MPRLAALEPELHEYATELVTALVEKPVSDLIADLAYPLPGRAGLGLLGIPVEDFDQIKAWSGGRVLFTYGHLSPDDQVQVAKNVIAFWHYVEGYVADRDADRGDDFTSDILRYHDERPEEVTIDDIVNIVYAMALAGHDSTTNAMGSMLRHLLAHQDQWRAVVEDRSLIPNAVEEALRFDGPVSGHRRTVAVDTELGGVAIPAGSRLVLLFASADRDPAHFAEPDRLDVCRENAVDHLSFGKGVHFCLGAPLARMEMRIAVGAAHRARARDAPRRRPGVPVRADHDVPLAGAPVRGAAVSGPHDACALGCYVLPGGVRDPRVALDQARATEALGFGAVWIGERFDTKDLPSLAGAIGQVTERVRIGAAVTVPGVRHPMVLASMGQTLQSLTGERFALGPRAIGGVALAAVRRARADARLARRHRRHPAPVVGR